MKVFVEPFVYNGPDNVCPPFVLSKHPEDATHYIECTPEERAVLDKTERLFFDLQKWIEERLRNTEVTQ